MFILLQYPLKRRVNGKENPVVPFKYVFLDFLTAFMMSRLRDSTGSFRSPQKKSKTSRQLDCVGIHRISTLSVSDDSQGLTREIRINLRL